MATSDIKVGRDTEIAQKNLRLSKPTDMTIHWKGVEEHFLMVPLVFRFIRFWGEKAFSEFFSNNLSPKRVNFPATRYNSI
jgi:hypothetical protein